MEFRGNPNRQNFLEKTTYNKVGRHTLKKIKQTQAILIYKGTTKLKLSLYSCYYVIKINLKYQNHYDMKLNSLRYRVWLKDTKGESKNIPYF